MNKNKQCIAANTVSLHSIDLFRFQKDDMERLLAALDLPEKYHLPTRNSVNGYGSHDDIVKTFCIPELLV